jgi:hypothetical protein
MTYRKLVIEYGGKKWYLDTHSTILSRKTSYHLMIGKLKYCRPKTKMNDDLKNRFLKWLRPEGIEYLKGIIKEHGHLLAVWNENGIPHVVPFQEVMYIRNWMRGQPEFADKLDSHWLDWAEFTEKALKG